MTSLQYNIGAPRALPNVYRFAGGAAEALVLDFLNDRGLSRGTTDFNDDASSHMSSEHNDAILMQDASGAWVSKAADVVMQEDHVGLQVTPATTNYARGTNYSAATVGVVGSGGALPAGWATTGTGYTFEVIAKGTLDGLPYIDLKITGGSGSNWVGIYSGANDAAPAAVGQVWTYKYGVQIIAGDLPPGCKARIAYREHSGVTGGVLERTESRDIELSTVLQWFTLTATTSDADTTFLRPEALYFERSSSLPNLLGVDVTIRLVAVQLEKEAFATPHIGTGSAAVARTGNIETHDTDPFDNGVCGFVKVNVKGLPLVNDCVFCVHDGTTTNQIKLACDGASWVMVVNAANVNQASVGMGAISLGEHTFVFAVGSNYVKARKVGGSDPAADTTATFPTTCDKVTLGGDGVTTDNNMYVEVREIVLRNIVGSEAELDDIYDNIALEESISPPGSLAVRVL